MRDKLFNFGVHFIVCWSKRRPKRAKKNLGKDGTWVSDFKQNGGSAPWPGRGYVNNKPKLKVYRYKTN